MINIIPNFLTDVEFTGLLNAVNRNDLHDVPNAYNTKSYHFGESNIYKKLCQFGKLAFQETLIYSVGGYSDMHIDGYSYTGGDPWVSTGILFCNDDYGGGELLFPKIGLKFKPKPNTFILFPAGVDSHVYEHGVSTVTSGERITTIFRFR